MGIYVCSLIILLSLCRIYNNDFQLRTKFIFFCFHIHIYYNSNRILFFWSYQRHNIYIYICCVILWYPSTRAWSHKNYQQIVLCTNYKKNYTCIKFVQRSLSNVLRVLLQINFAWYLFYVTLICLFNNLYKIKNWLLDSMCQDIQITHNIYIYVILNFYPFFFCNYYLYSHNVIWH